MREYIPKADNFLDEIWSDQAVSIIQKEHKLAAKAFKLYDVFLNGQKKPVKDLYTRSVFYRKNVRHGNTVISNQDNKYTEFARKGLPVIFDVKLEHLRNFQKAKHNPKIDKNQRSLAEIIFEGAKIAFQEGRKVELIKTENIAGHNVQVSFNEQFDSWIVAEKTISVLAEKVQDLAIYKEAIYGSVVEVAKIWFQQISKLKIEKLKDLKNLLKNKTAIGSCRKNGNYESFVGDQYVGIKWFAIVDNNSEEICIDPFQAKKEFEKFGFNIVKFKSIVTTNSSETFYSKFEQLYLQIAEAGIEDQEFGLKGSVIYFVMPQNGNKGIGRHITVGVAKLKTLEYAVYQKIKQKVQRYAIKKENTETIIEKFQKEFQNLKILHESKTPYPKEYYCKILKAILELIDSAHLKEQYVKQKFATILKIVFYALNKRLPLLKYGNSMINDTIFVQKVKQNQFSKYNGLGCKTKIVYIVLGLPGMFKSFLGKKLSLHFQKINMQYKILHIQNPDTDLMSKQLEQLYKPSSSHLQHFYLDGAFDSETISSFIKLLQKNGDQDTYYKPIIIRDEGKNNFVCSNEDEYPFRLQTIIMCYYGQHELKTDVPRLQQRIANLKQVTEKLRKNANFKDSISKLDIQQYQFPFSQKSRISKVQEFERIIKDILKAEEGSKEFNAYGNLIIRLQQIDGIDYLPEDTINNELENLIKASYPSIPLISFKKNDSL